MPLSPWCQPPPVLESWRWQTRAERVVVAFCGACGCLGWSQRCFLGDRGEQTELGPGFPPAAALGEGVIPVRTRHIYKGSHSYMSDQPWESTQGSHCAHFTTHLQSRAVQRLTGSHTAALW